MSYKNAILNSRPLAYYPFTLKPTYSTLLADFNTYQDYLQTIATYQDVIPANSFTDLVNGYATTEVGTVDSQIIDVAPLTSRRNDDLTVGACRIYDGTKIKISNNYNFFVKGYEQISAGIEAWVLLNQSPVEKTTLFSVTDTSSNVLAEVYAISDILYFTVKGRLYNKSTDSYSDTTYITKKQILNWNSKVHIFAVYSEKTIKICVNGIYDESISIDSNFEFYSDSEVDIVVGPASSGNYYTISDVALYSRNLSLNEIRNHMFWSNVDSGPDNFAKQGSSYYIDVKTNNGMFSAKRNFVVKSDYDLGYYNGLISDGTGLTLQTTDTSQEGYGYWLYNFPIVNNSGAAGIDISWDTGSLESSTANSRYIVVSTSYDNGLTFNEVGNNKKVPYFISSSATSLFIKVEIYSPDTSFSVQPRIDNLFVGIYNSIQIIGDSGGFAISPTEGNTYMIRKNTNGFLYRSKNFGINFSNQDPNSNNGVAKIYSENNTPYHALEFWFKYNGQGGMIVDSGLADPFGDLYIDQSTGHLKTTFFTGTLFINGQDKTGGDIPLTVGESYHIIVSYSTQLTDSIYINGAKSGWLTPCDAVYGYFSVYPNQVNLSQAQNRYLSYLTTINQVVNDGVTGMGSLSEYSGTVSMFNSGNPIVFNDYVL
jgi:hypothetical protein